jgi:hypothetical protein
MARRTTGWPEDASQGEEKDAGLDSQHLQIFRTYVKFLPVLESGTISKDILENHFFISLAFFAQQSSLFIRKL